MLSKRHAPARSSQFILNSKMNSKKDIKLKNRSNKAMLKQFQILKKTTISQKLFNNSKKWKLTNDKPISQKNSISTFQHDRLLSAIIIKNKNHLIKYNKKQKFGYKKISNQLLQSKKTKLILQQAQQKKDLKDINLSIQSDINNHNDDIISKKLNFIVQVQVDQGKQKNNLDLINQGQQLDQFQYQIQTKISGDIFKEKIQDLDQGHAKVQQVQSLVIDAEIQEKKSLPDNIIQVKCEKKIQNNNGNILIDNSQKEKITSQQKILVQIKEDLAQQVQTSLPAMDVIKKEDKCLNNDSQQYLIHSKLKEKQPQTQSQQPKSQQVSYKNLSIYNGILQTTLKSTLDFDKAKTEQLSFLNLLVIFTLLLTYYPNSKKFEFNNHKKKCSQLFDEGINSQNYRLSALSPHKIILNQLKFNIIGTIFDYQRFSSRQDHWSINQIRIGRGYLLLFLLVPDVIALKVLFNFVKKVALDIIPDDIRFQPIQILSIFSQCIICIQKHLKTDNFYLMKRKYHNFSSYFLKLSEQKSKVLLQNTSYFTKQIQYIQCFFIHLLLKKIVLSALSFVKKHYQAFIYENSKFRTTLKLIQVFKFKSKMKLGASCNQPIINNFYQSNRFKLNQQIQKIQDNIQSQIIQNSTIKNIQIDFHSLKTFQLQRFILFFKHSTFYVRLSTFSISSCEHLFSYLRSTKVDQKIKLKQTDNHPIQHNSRRRIVLSKDFRFFYIASIFFCFIPLYRTLFTEERNQKIDSLIQKLIISFIQFLIQAGIIAVYGPLLIVICLVINILYKFYQGRRITPQIETQDNNQNDGIDGLREIGRTVLHDQALLNDTIANMTINYSEQIEMMNPQGNQELQGRGF